MAVEELERVFTQEKTERSLRECSVPSRMEFLEEDEHNARIKFIYKRLINPDNKIEDVFNDTKNEVAEEEIAEAAVETPVQQAPVVEKPYQVEGARANAAIFRADSAINARAAVAAPVAQAEETAQIQSAPQATVKAQAEDEDEDLRPTPTTIQYQTLGKEGEKKKIISETRSKSFAFGKREKIIVAIFVAVVIALVALVIINSAIISNLNADIAHVQESITTVRGALAGVNSTVEEIIGSSINH